MESRIALRSLTVRQQKTAGTTAAVTENVETKSHGKATKTAGRTAAATENVETKSHGKATKTAGTTAAETVSR